MSIKYHSISTINNDNKEILLNTIDKNCIKFAHMIDSKGMIVMCFPSRGNELYVINLNDVIIASKLEDVEELYSIKATNVFDEFDIIFIKADQKNSNLLLTLLWAIVNNGNESEIISNTNENELLH